MDVCVCCGTYTPEGSQLCWRCLREEYEHIKFRQDVEEVALQQESQIAPCRR